MSLDQDILEVIGNIHKSRNGWSSDHDLLSQVRDVLARCSAEIEGLRESKVDLRARLQTAEQQIATERAYVKKMDGIIEEVGGVTASCINPYEDLKRALEGQKKRAERAEQQLGQVREAVLRLKAILMRITSDEVYEKFPSGGLSHQDMACDVWPERMTWIVDTALDGLAADKAPATPSDGCGKGRTLSARLPDEQGLWWWQSDGESAPVAVHIAFSGCGGDYFATIGQYGWTEPQSVKDMGGLWLKAVEPRMVPYHEFEEAASSSGEEGGR